MTPTTFRRFRCDVFRVSELRRSLRMGWASLVLLAVWPALAAAQGVTNPVAVEFDVPSEHAVILPDGTAAITSYALQITEVGASAPLSTTDLGKPTPDVAGHVRATPQVLIGLPANRTYTAVIKAIGPGGEAVSDPSNPFGRAGPPSPPRRVTLTR